MRWTLLAGFAVRVLALFGLWMLLVDSADEPNMITGAVCVVVFAGLATAVNSLRTEHARPRIEMLRFVYRPLTLLVTDTARVTCALVAHCSLRRPYGGHLRAARYNAVSDDPEDVARRVLTEWGASLGPNRYVIGVDTDRRLLLIHELVRSSAPLDPLELG
jgi:hypothetical protein